MAAHHDRAGAVGPGLVAVRPLDGARVRTLHAFGLDRLQRAEARGGEVARDAVHAEAIAAVGRHLDLDNRIVEAERLGGGDAGLRFGRQVDDAVMIVAELELAHRAEHAVALLAADLADLEVHVGAGDVAARRGEHGLHARARVGRAAHDLHDSRAGIDLADAQAIGVGMLHGLDHVAHDEALQGLGRIGDALDFEAEHGQRIAHFGEARVGLDMLLEPGKRELHRATPSSAEKP